MLYCLESQFLLKIVKLIEVMILMIAISKYFLRKYVIMVLLLLLPLVFCIFSLFYTLFSMYFILVFVIPQYLFKFFFARFCLLHFCSNFCSEWYFTLWCEWRQLISMLAKCCKYKHFVWMRALRKRRKKNKRNVLHIHLMYNSININTHMH